MPARVPAPQTSSSTAWRSPRRLLALAAAALATVTLAAVTVGASDGKPSEPTPAEAAPAELPSAVAAHKSTQPKPAKGRRYVVAAMGDSLTDPRSHGGKYLNYLKKKCPESRFDSYGVGGNMVNQMRRRFARDILGEPDPSKRKLRTAKGVKPESLDPQLRYSHMLILGGINDICSDETALRTNDKIKKDLSFMYAAARQGGLKVFAMTLPPWGGFTRYYNKRRGASTLDMNRWIAQQHRDGVIDGLLDVYPLMSCGDPEMLCKRYGWPDKVHWSTAGHKRVGEALHQKLFSDCK